MTETEIRFASAGARLGGTMLRPALNSALAVILLAGSGHHDRDETVCGQTPFRRIALHLAGHGIASLRFDSRGVGASEGDQEKVTFETKVADALAANRFLQAEGFADGQIVLVGHSEGGLVAAAASRHCGAPVAMLAGPAVPVRELIDTQSRAISRLAGVSEAQIELEAQMNRAAFLKIQSAPASDIAAELQSIFVEHLSVWPGQDGTAAEIAETAGAMVHALLAEDFRSLLMQDPPGIMAALDVPVLAIFADRDCQVEAGANRSAFEAATAGNTRARAVTLARHNHLFQIAETGAIEEYETLGQSPSPEALACLTGWLLDQKP